MQADPALIVDLFLNRLNEKFHIGARGATIVHDEIAMLWTDLGAAFLKTTKASSIDTFPGARAIGISKYASTAWKLNWLSGLTALDGLRKPLLNGIRVLSFQLQRSCPYELTFLKEVLFSVGELEIGSLNRSFAAAEAYGFDGLEALPDPALRRSGVHENSAAKVSRHAA